MATEVTNIDDLLTAGNSSLTPPTPESKELPAESYTNDYEEPHPESEPDEPESNDEDSEKGAEHDDYGNTKTAAKTYTEEEVNERINKAVRERLSRANSQHQQPTQQQINQQTQGFEYNPESTEPWEVQLEKFVEKTVSKIGQKQAEKQKQEQDAAHQAVFEDNFNRGMSKFSDFREVVGAQPVTDAMTYALRGLNDPAAFIYAASKRNPEELARISKIADPVAQIMEMGRLEERMRKSASGTKAPKPVSRSRDDATIPSNSKKKEPTIEDLIAKSDAKRRAILNQRRGR